MKARPHPRMLFVFPPREGGNFAYHLGASYIVAYLRERGIYAEQFVNGGLIGTDELLDRILDRKPDIIGFTCFDANYPLVSLLARRLKEEAPHLLIVAGGPTPTFSDVQLLRDLPWVDLCVRGEGEETVYELIRRYRKDGDLGSIAGVTCRLRGRIVRVADRPLLQDASGCLDIIASPYLSGVLPLEGQRAINGDISIITARGCTFRCTYCNFSALSQHARRQHSVERVLAELRFIARSSLGEKFTVTVMDDTFTADRERTALLARRIIRERLRLTFRFETRADCLDGRLLRLLKLAGFREVNFGLESASPEVLAKAKKVRPDYNGRGSLLPEKKFLRAVKTRVRLAKGLGFRTSVSIILGLPGESYRRGMESINFVKALGVDEYSHNLLQLYPGTELFRSYHPHLQLPHRKSFRYHLLNAPDFFRYDLRRIPLLAHERGITMRGRMSLLSLVDALMGTYAHVRQEGYPSAVILCGDRPPLVWLRDKFAFQTRLIYGRGVEALGRIEQESEALLMVGLSVFSPDYDDFDLTRREAEVDEAYKKRLICLPFSSYCRGGSPDRQGGLAFSVCRNEDAEALYGLSHQGLARLCSRDCFIVDACRWSARSCPAASLPRVVIGKDSGVRTCFSAPSVGMAGEDLVRIRERLARFARRERLRRGCDSCTANEWCSQCLFTGALKVRDFCAIKKRYIDTSAIERLQLSREIAYAACFMR